MIKQLFKIYKVKETELTSEKQLKLLKFLIDTEQGVEIYPVEYDDGIHYNVKIVYEGHKLVKVGKTISEALTNMFCELYESYNRIDKLDEIRDILK